jgi:polysaccharide pyruvyl transferase WcaK-like protein
VDDNVLAMSIHHHPHGSTPEHSIWAKAKRVSHAGFARSVFVSHFTDDRQKALHHLEPVTVVPEFAGDRTIKAETGAVGMCISTRYHAAVFALSAGVPYLGFYQDRYTHAKLKGAFEVLGLEPQVYPVDRLGPELVQKAWECREEQAARIRERLPRARYLYEQERGEILRRLGA